MEEELPALVAHGVRLVPVLVEDCLWDHEPQLAAVQWAHDPGRDGPLAAARRREVDGRIVRVCRTLLEVVPVAGPLSGPAAPVPAGASPGRVAALAPGPAGPLHGVPALPAGYLERAELGGLGAALLGAGAVGVTGDVHGLGMYGQGGIGKTVLAAAAARDRVIRAHFPDGVFWITAGEQPDLAGLQARLLSELGAAGPAPRSAIEGAAMLRQELADRQVLLVIDDVWSAVAAQGFRVTGPRGRVLYTTRDPAVLAAAGAVAEPVGVLSVAAARQLLARLADLPEGALPPEADRVLAATGRVALAVALAGAAVRGGATWPQLAAELDRGGETFLDHPYANTFKALQAATAALDPGLAFAYTSLAVYPPDTRVPVAAVSRYWGHLRGASPGQIRAELQMLADRELLVLDRDEIAFHDLQHSYLLLQADNLAPLHDGLLAGYRALLAPDGTGWWQLSASEPYIWDHLLYHLLGAGDRSGAASTVTDLAYLAKRIALAGPHAAETDLDQAAAVHLGDPRIGWLRDWLARHAHVLAGLADPADVAVTVAGWLASPPTEIDRHRLDPLLPSLYPAPRWGLPTSRPPCSASCPATPDPVHAVAFSPDGRRLASAGEDGTVRLWDPATGAEQATLTGHTGAVAAVAFSPDGRRLASAGADGTVRLWDPVTGAEQATLTGHDGPVAAVAFSPDGRRLASAGADGTVRLWDPATGAEQATLTGHTGRVTAVAFSPDGRRLASAGSDRTVRLWDPVTGAEQATLTGHTGRVYAVAFSPDGRRLASAGRDRTVRLWDPATGAEQATLTGHTGRVHAVAFSPDGRRLASAGQDGMVRLWDPATGAEQATLTGHTGWVDCGGVQPGRAAARLRRRGRDGAAVGPGHRRRAGHPHRPHRPGDRGGVQPGRAAARLRRRRRDGAAVGPGHRRRAGHPHRPHRLGERGGVQPGRAAARLRRRGRDGAAVGPGHRRRAGHPHRPRPAGCTRWRSARTGGGSPPPGRATGTVRLWDPATGAEQATLTGHTGWVYRGGVQPGRAAARLRRRRRDGAAVGPGHRRRAGHPDRPHRPGDRGGVQPGRAAAGLRR